MDEYLKKAEKCIEEAEETEDYTEKYILYRKAELFINIAQVKMLEERLYEIEYQITTK